MKAFKPLSRVRWTGDNAESACEPTLMKRIFGVVANLITYANVAVAGSASTEGTVTITLMLLGNAGLLALDSLKIRSLSMHRRTMEVVGEPAKYRRRRGLAEQLIKESGRDDWAVGMGLIVKPEGGNEPAKM